MAELELHAEGTSDRAGQRIGVLAAVLAVLLAVVSIASHRSHTRAVVLKSEENDTWQYYQSNRIKLHSLELGVDLVRALGAKGPEAESTVSRYEADESRYKQAAKDTQERAESLGKEVERTERSALFYDFGEGLLEIGLVLTSLYFISRKKLFPVIGLIAGIAGAATALAGLLH